MNHDALAEKFLHDFQDYLARFNASYYQDRAQVAKALNYALAAGGKCVRPVLAMLCSHTAGGDPAGVLPAALAIEMVHTYSLVHDDLPCMDNDDLRRGRPTTHKVFGEAQALLAGDGLLTDAFAVLSGAFDPDLGSAQLPGDRRLDLIRELSIAAGSRGMVKGQSLDLEWTASATPASVETLNEIHLRKTGDLLGAAAAMGVISAGQGREIAGAFREFGRLTGLAFQIIDDLMDTSSTTGKTPGKDAAQGKLTYMTIMSRDAAAHTAETMTTRAISLIADTGLEISAVRSFVTGLLQRTR